MAQSAFNDWMTIEADTWTLISEVDCTYVAIDSGIEITVSTGTPNLSQRGIPYAAGLGQDVGVSTLAQFPSETGPTGIYAISRGRDARVFVSRPVVV